MIVYSDQCMLYTCNINSPTLYWLSYVVLAYLNVHTRAG